jgi:signal transduction histidine kinase
VLAARVEGAELRPPSEAAWRALAALAGPTDLAGASDPELAKLAEEHGFLAAAPLRSDGGEPIAVLLLGADDAEGPARPRLLAALGAAVTKSLRPATAAAALERLARLDAEVQRIDRLAAVGGLLAEIVHEIRNPLVSIKTFLHLLGEEDGGDPSEFRDVAIEELRRIERLLEAVSQHARPPSAPSAEAIAEIEPAVRSVAQLATLRAVVRRVRVEVELASPLSPARIAGDALRQILLNLALNAIEAAPEGGQVRIAAAERGGSVEIALEDDGPGVPEVLRARVFEPFFSTKSQPGGLGLAITRRLVEDAGGRIEVQSRAPTGSRFCVTLPIAR